MSQLPIVLHELTHHWCFASPVGVALSLLSMRSRSAVAASGGRDWEDDEDVIRCEVNYNFTMSMLQPLLEGMAEFAEFDLFPGNSQVGSNILSTVPAFFLPQEQLNDNMLTYFKNGLRTHRTDTWYLERKKALLSHPFDCAKSGYLPGYLFVKAILGTLLFKADLLADTDFFLMYLRSYFFEDWDFVELLLNPELNAEESPYQIMDYFMQRIQLFMTMDHAEMTRDFERRVLTHEGPAYQLRFWQTTGKLESCPVTPHQYHESLQNLLNTYTAKLESTTVERQAEANLIDGLLSFRDVITLGHAVMEVRVNQAGRMNIYSSNDHILLSFAAPDNFKVPGSYQLDVETIFVREPGGLYVVFSKDGKILHHMSMSQRQLSGAQLERYVGRSNVFRAMEVWNKAAEALKTDPVCAAYSEVASDYLDLNMNRIYQTVSLIYVPDDFLEQAANALSDRGVAALYPGEQLDKAAAASTLYYNDISPSSPKAQDLLRQPDIGRLVDELNAPVLRALGFNNFALLPNGALFSVLF